MAEALHTPIGGGVAIHLRNGQPVMVDRADYPLVSNYRWMSNGRYAVAKIEGRLVPMHRLILQLTDPAVCVDHIDGDGFNNRRSNLRRATHAENMRNRCSVSGVSRFKGVYRDRRNWRAEIKADGKKVRLGSFVSEASAARAYDRAARKLHGEFAKTNADLGLL